MITLKNVSKWYGHFQVLTDCSTEVKKGEVVVVCGPSGSGKSTLIKTVNGLEPVQQGEITVDGIVVNDKKTDLAKLRSRRRDGVSAFRAVPPSVDYRKPDPGAGESALNAIKRRLVKKH
ncbi:glutamate/aspartate ABC transporter ATP-binding protein [Escherichia coli]|uniref:Glutamate/aspartate ABC transporter ATP-binding protein n=1 Tax=Escherichia coli TaxID=562 RepID=A0A484VTP7_ECOLX|nr:glutamate/aspartate ABC transporter ATP-binding protein [Escherichia coli]